MTGDTNDVGEGAPRRQQSVRLSQPLRRRLRLWAAFQDREISDLVEEAVTRYLDELEQERAARGLPLLPPPDE